MSVPDLLGDALRRSPGSEPVVLTGARRMLGCSSSWLAVQCNTIVGGVRTLAVLPVHVFFRDCGYEVIAVGGAELLLESWGIAGYCNLFYLPS